MNYTSMLDRVSAYDPHLDKHFVAMRVLGIPRSCRAALRMFQVEDSMRFPALIRYLVDL